jgi:hypothetical protein
MQNAMSLTDLLGEVIRQGKTKSDKITSTKDNVRMVPALPGEATPAPKLVLLRAGAGELERYDIAENAHQQIAGRLEIPWKYYNRLLADHPDMVMDQVNKLFEREPAMRLLRILDGRVRAFLSDRYLRLDNAEVLEHALPQIVKGDFATTMLATHVDDQSMHIKCLFTGDELAHTITTARGQDRVMRPGFRISNSETGQGKFRIEAFFYDSYCKNGCVWGSKDVFSFERSHLGSRLIEGADFMVVSPATVQAMNDLIKHQTHDALATISNPERVAAMAEALRAAANTEACAHPMAAVDMAIKTLPLRETEREGILETFMRDGDYTQYGMAAAITEQANDPAKCTVQRAYELENIGAQLLQLSAKKWNQFATAELLAA